MTPDDGSLQPFALTVDKFLDHAAKWHPRAQVVSRELDGAIKRTGYAALRMRARRLSTALLTLGVSQGAKVATLGWNTQGHVEAWYAIMGIGAVCHTLNPRLPAEQSAAMLKRSGATILIATSDLEDFAAEIAGGVSQPVRVLTMEDGLDALIDAAAGEAGWGDFDEQAPCGLCFTSGTTGAPKGVTYTHRGNYLHTLRQLQADVIGLTARDAVLAVVPMFHANAWGLPFAAPAVGAKLVLPGRHTDGASLAEMILSEGVTIAAGVPTVWLGLIDHLDAAGFEVPTLKRLMTGGAPMPQALMDRFEARGIEVQTTWGMTELSPLGVAMPPQSPDRSSHVAGRPAMGIDLLLTDAAGEPLAEQRGEEGHLWVKGPSVVERYAGEARASTTDGWFPTGDLATISEDGCLSITGRSKDLIKSGGEWINPAEIEARVGALSGVKAAAVIGREDKKWGERPILLVEMASDSDLTDDMLLTSLRGTIASWWIPDEVVRLPAMPLAATGKVDKLQLRRRFSHGD
jgi:fatty-acyl-CoA synthase